MVRLEGMPRLCIRGPESWPRLGGGERHGPLVSSVYDLRHTPQIESATHRIRKRQTG